MHTVITKEGKIYKQQVLSISQCIIYTNLHKCTSKDTAASYMEDPQKPDTDAIRSTLSQKMKCREKTARNSTKAVSLTCSSNLAAIELI